MTEARRWINRIGAIVAGFGAVLWATQGELGMAVALWVLGGIQFYFGFIFEQEER